MRWVLFAYLTAFCAAILLLTWVFQSFLLNKIYTRILLSRMDAAAVQLARIGDEEDAALGAQVISANSQIGIAVFAAGDETLGSQLFMAGAGAGSVLPRLTNAQYAQLYAAARANGGCETRNFSDNVSFQPPDGGVEVDLPSLQLSADLHRVVRVRVMETPHGNQVAVFMDAAVVPVGSVAGALHVEMLILSLLLVLGALLLARMMSRRLATPIARLTEKAGLRAGGHYDISFSEKTGYREIDELSAALDYAAHELSRVDELQKELIANISHDLRTPLTMIIGYGEIMRDIEGENKPENVQVIVDEAKRLSALVDDLLQISRYRAGGEALSCSVFDLAEEFRQTGARYAQLLAAQGFVFSIEVPSPLPVCADRARILQVICNLVNNAVNYAGQNKEIILRGRQTDDGYARIEVIDHGEGIAPEKLADIWQRYYKADTQHKRSVVGSGLGLSIVRGILEMHGARYGVESRLGEGSLFWFALPIQ